MADSVTVRRIGNSYGVILPKAELDKLGVVEGDKLFIVRTPDGIRLTPYDPDFAKVMEATREYMRDHRDALKDLAK
ncbi:MAG: AbrB/MazE/SpoVT family DNA-binding domain-containing protein [Proteobacteria bacterium]|nr:AbrB/MazE/SpoVT family DNA-binding domain-containing protein [Pseudomonadota bacterium]MCH7958089.1 AbrB/MazE/SpoVT family DNA-binding domain-containing protein [Pseudomonadota bacterium]